MTETGGPAWIERQAAQVAAIAVDPSVRIVLQQLIDDDPTRSWHVVVADGIARLHEGRHPEPDVTLTMASGTATAIVDGRTAPQREFLDGRIRIGGDIGALMDAREALAVLVPGPAT